MDSCAVSESFNSDEMMQRVIFALETARPVPRDLAKWLAHGFRRYLAGAASLDDVLGLDRLSVAERIQRRNAILRELAATMAPSRPAQIARRIAYGRALPDPEKILLNQAARIAPIPKKRQLLRIINREQCSKAR